MIRTNTAQQRRNQLRTIVAAAERGSRRESLRGSTDTRPESLVEVILVPSDIEYNLQKFVSEASQSSLLSLQKSIVDICALLGKPSQVQEVPTQVGTLELYVKLASCLMDANSEVVNKDGVNHGERAEVSVHIPKEAASKLLKLTSGLAAATVSTAIQRDNGTVDTNNTQDNSRIGEPVGEVVSEISATVNEANDNETNEGNETEVSPSDTGSNEDGPKAIEKYTDKVDEATDLVVKKAEAINSKIGRNGWIVIGVAIALLYLLTRKSSKSSK